MKNILFLSYYFEPDLSAGSFRNTSLSQTLAEYLKEKATLQVYCTQPNRYQQTSETVLYHEKKDNCNIYRIQVPQHGNGFFRQIRSFLFYRRQVLELTRNQQFDFIYASSSKLFTAYLAYEVAKRKKIKYYIDLRDLFAENLEEFIPIPVLNIALKRWVQQFFERPCLMNAAHININSQGFRDSLPRGYTGTVSFFPNGVDDYFLNWRRDTHVKNERPLVTYAGNIGEAQGMHLILPTLAKRLEGRFDFLIVGEGSMRNRLMQELRKAGVNNVEWRAPVKRHALLEIYQRSDYLFIHLNRHKSLEKVLPSKLFEYAAGNVPILAGVSGYPRQFIQKEVKSNVFCFDPGAVEPLCQYLLNNDYHLASRPEFVTKFSRKEVNLRMAKSIMDTFKKG